MSKSQQPVAAEQVPPDMNLTRLAVYLGLSRETCRRLVMVRGLIPHERPSDRVVIVRGADALRYKQSCRREAVPQPT